jgi:COPI associated protein
MLSLFNCILAAAMGALGVLTLLAFKPDSDVLTTAFLSIYMVVFGGLLFLYELIWWQPIAHLNRMFRKNFGFMYGLKGKGFFLIFIAFLCLGLRDNAETAVEGLDWATGIGWLAGGIIHISLAFCWPEIAAKYRPPTAGLSDMGDDQNIV